MSLSRPLSRTIARPLAQPLASEQGVEAQPMSSAVDDDDESIEEETDGQAERLSDQAVVSAP